MLQATVSFLHKEIIHDFVFLSNKPDICDASLLITQKLRRQDISYANLIYILHTRQRATTFRDRNLLPVVFDPRLSSFLQSSQKDMFVIHLAHGSQFILLVFII